MRESPPGQLFQQQMHYNAGGTPRLRGQGNISRQPLANHDLIAHEKAGMHPGER